MIMSDADKEVLAGEKKLAEMNFKAALSKFKKAIKLAPSSAWSTTTPGRPRTRARSPRRTARRSSASASST
jgi:hypothetical protein